MKKPTGRAALAGLTLRNSWRVMLAGALIVALGCTTDADPNAPLVVSAADYTADSVHFQFDVVGPNVPSGWAWYIDLDTDQLTGPNGHKTGYGEFGSEFRVWGRDRIADSVAVRPTSGPVDPAPAAGGWPFPAGYGRLDPSAAVSVRIPKAVLADEGVMGYKIWIYDPGPIGGWYFFKEGITTPRPGSLRASGVSGGSSHGARAVQGH